MRRTFLVSAGVFALAACSDSLPLESVAPRVALTATGSTAPSRYALLFRGGAPSDFAATVQALGGTIELLHTRAGIAIIGGISENDAASLQAIGGVDLVVEDFNYRGVTHRVAGVAEQVGLEGVALQSQANPTTALAFARQWNMNAIGAPAAWAKGHRGSKGVDVAILDSGIDPTYLDLDGLVDTKRAISLVPTKKDLPKGPVADAQLTDDLLIEKFFAGQNRPLWTDLNGHGSHVASTVSSRAIINAGVTSYVTLIPVKVMNAKGNGSFTAILNGILYATDVGADVINASLGALFPRRDNKDFTKLLDAVTRYARDAGVTIVVAAGNDAAPLSPSTNGLYGAFCSTKNVLCVSATGPNAQASVNGPWSPSLDLWAIYTNAGNQVVDVAAPGGNYAVDATGKLIVDSKGVPSAAFVWAACSKTKLVLIEPELEEGAPEGAVPPPAFWVLDGCAANPAGLYTLPMLGTSMAAPHVAGLAALLVEKYGRNPQAIEERIKHTADDIREFGKPGKDDFYGWGRINVTRALGL